MKIKAKYIYLMGAFICLTLVGYLCFPKNEVVINVKETMNSGEIQEENYIYVHIEGAISEPGIKKVVENTRLFELIDVAGGELEDADLSKVNLASVLKDEQKVYIPYKISDSEIVNNTDNLKNDYNNFVNINSANSEELQKLEGIGPSMADKILKYREENGYFNKIEDLKNISGIGEAKFDKIKNNITI